MLNEALKNLESALKELIDINEALDETLIVAVTDQRGTITFANKKFCEISKYSKEELLGQNHRIINSGYHSKEFFRQMWRTIANGRIWRGEICNKAKDGTLYWVDTTIVPCLNEKGKPYQYVSFRIDITDRKRAEEYLRRNDKVEAVAHLAAGIAHEIRNPLAAIKMGIQALQVDNAGNQQLLDTMLAELDRVDSIVGEFLYLSKPQETIFRDSDIRTVLEVTVALMSISARQSGVQIHLHGDEPVPTVRCAVNQLKQVFINVLKNAIESMPTGGNIDVDLLNSGDDHVLVRFTDQGCGIPQEDLAHIGEPFYTTKEKGTGLGLVVSHKIIEDHGGKMWIKSKVGEGTVVEILLPCSGAV